MDFCKSWCVPRSSLFLKHLGPFTNNLYDTKYIVKFRLYYREGLPVVFTTLLNNTVCVGRPYLGYYAFAICGKNNLVMIIKYLKSPENPVD